MVRKTPWTSGAHRGAFRSAVRCQNWAFADAVSDRGPSGPAEGTQQMPDLSAIGTPPANHKSSWTAKCARLTG